MELSDAGHVVVYWTTGTEETRLRTVLRKFPDQRFYVYGFDKSATVRNCVFKRLSTEGFLADLASARGVVASAGFSLISECMYWRKKMLLLPLAGQREVLRHPGSRAEPPADAGQYCHTAGRFKTSFRRVVG